MPCREAQASGIVSAVILGIERGLDEPRSRICSQQSFPRGVHSRSPEGRTLYLNDQVKEVDNGCD